MQASLDMDSDAFIQEVMARPEIWKIKHPHHKNKNRVKKQWEELRKRYPDSTVDELKKRWKNLKDTYRKELKRLPQSRQGAPAENFRSNWRYFDALNFLKDELCFAGKEGIEVDGNATIPDQDKNYNADGSPKSPKSDEEVNEPTSGKRRDPRTLREEFLKIEKKKMKILEEEIAKNNEHTKSDNYHFLMSLLPEMDKLPPLQKMRLRTKISQAVLDEVSMTMYNNQTYAAVQQLQFQENADSNIDIKEESINMYD